MKTFAVAVALTVVASAAQATPIPVATYNFDDTFAAEEAGAPAITPINPLGLNGFITDTVFGETRRVYRFDGSTTPSLQGGLELNTTGLLDGDDSFSVEMVFQFDIDRSDWEAIMGVSNRTDDRAFYVHPTNRLQVWPLAGGPTPFTYGEYHHVTFTNDGANNVTAYLDGIFQFDLTTDIMNFSLYAGANPDRLLHFFVDNLVGGGLGEFNAGTVALIRLYDFELSEEEVEDIGEDPFAEVPTPGALALLGFGLLGLGLRRRGYC